MENYNVNEKMTLGQIINSSVDLYKKHFKLLLNISLIFLLPVVILSVFTIDAVTELQQILTNFDPLKFDFSIFKSISIVVYISIIEAIIFLCYKMVLIKISESIIIGNNPEVKQSILFVLKKFILILFTNILMFFMMLFGFILFIIPGFIILGMLLFVPQAMMLENKFFFTSFDRSFFVIKKNFWEAITVPVILYFVYFFITMITSSIISIFNFGPSILDMIKSGEVNETPFLSVNKWVNFADTFITYIVFILITPLIEIAVTMKFINLRNIKEGRGILSALNTNETNPS